MKIGEPRRSVTAALSPKLYLDFVAYAKAQQVTRATLVRQALAAYLAKGQAPIVSPGRSWELDGDE